MDTLYKDYLQYEAHQELLMKYVKFQFIMKKSTEGEQQPLPDDLASIEENIKDLIEKTEHLTRSIKFGFSTVRNLQVEIDEMLDMYRQKNKEASTDANAQTTDGH